MTIRAFLQNMTHNYINSHLSATILQQTNISPIDEYYTIKAVDAIDQV